MVWMLHSYVYVERTVYIQIVAKCCYDPQCKPFALSLFEAYSVTYENLYSSLREESDIHGGICSIIICTDHIQRMMIPLELVNFRIIKQNDVVN